jgi:PAS domain S-box-containing protein
MFRGSAEKKTTAFPLRLEGAAGSGSRVRRYGIALLCVGLAAGIHWALLPLLSDQWGAAIFLLAVVVAAAYGGFGPALLATGVGGIAEVFFWSLRHPPASLAAPANWVVVASYLLAGCTVALVIRARENALARITEDRDRLKQLERDLRASLATLVESKNLAEKVQRQAVAERDALQAELHTSQERMGIAQGAGRLCLFDWDIAGGTMFVGGELEEVFGVRKEEWSGYESWIRAVHAEDRARVESEVRECLAGQVILDVEFRVVWSDGSVHWVVARGSTSHDEQAAQRMAGIFQDVTRRKATEEALVANEKLAAAGRLAASIAHEINNPLAAVTNLLFIIKGDSTLSGAGRQYLALAEQELARAAQIAKQTLGFYKDQTEPTNVDVAELLDEVLAFYQRNMPAHVTLERRYSHKLNVLAREGEVRQVIGNLVTNALQVLREGGTVEVAAHRTQQQGEGGVLITVKDNGPGIEAEHLEHIFEPFFTTGMRGTGLGLWLVKQIVKKHGGSVHVESSRDAQRHGTRFSFFLPARESARTAAAAAPQSDSATPTARAS